MNQEFDAFVAQNDGEHEDVAPEFVALDRVSGELRAAEAPALDWARVEQRLLARIEADEAARRALVTTRVPSGFLRAIGFAAAAAVLAIGVTSISSSGGGLASSTPTRHDVDASALAAGVTGDLELLSLHEGDVVTAGAEPLRFGHEGVVSWTLAPRSRAVVRSLGQSGVGNVIALETGSVHAEVTPRVASEGMVEAFAVEVEGTRVAVHGTAFTVARVDDRVLVDVEHGSVAVGPAGHAGETSGHLLIAPARASFSLDGGRSATFLSRAQPLVAPPPAESVAVAAPVRAGGLENPAPSDSREVAGEAAAASAVGTIASPRPRAVAAAAQPAGEKAAEPAQDAAPAVVAEPVAKPSLTPETVKAGLSRCYAQHYGASSDGVALRVSTTYRIKLNADGSVKSAVLDPPMSKAFIDCAGTATFSGKFEPGSADLTLPLQFGK